MHYLRGYYACQVPGVPQLQAKGSQGPGGHNNLSESALKGLLYFISPLFSLKYDYFQFKNGTISCFYFTTKHTHDQYRVSSRQNRWLYCPLVLEGSIKFSVLPSGIQIANLA